MEKGKYIFERISGRFYLGRGRNRRAYLKGDRIAVDHPSQLGKSRDRWRLISTPEDKSAATPSRPIKRRGDKKKTKAHARITLPSHTTDGVETSGFAPSGEFEFHGKMRPCYSDPKTGKQYWLSEDNYLSPIILDGPNAGSDEDGTDLPENGSVSCLKAVHVGGGWYDVINESTGQPINDKKLRKADAEGLVDGKIVESA